jgi:hypothetical protein
VRFRPGDLPEGDPSEPNTPVEWEDNWLSNFFAWFSHYYLPNWCQTPEHFTSRVTQYLFTDCPCCLLFRGITVGFALAVAVALAILVPTLIFVKVVR